MPPVTGSRVSQNTSMPAGVGLRTGVPPALPHSTADTSSTWVPWPMSIMVMGTGRHCQPQRSWAMQDAALPSAMVHPGPLGSRHKWALLLGPHSHQVRQA